MRYPKFALMILCFFFIVFCPLSSQAEQKGPAPKAVEKVPLPAGQPILLQQPIKAELAGTSFLCTDLINTINSVIQIAHKDLQATVGLYTPKAGDHLSFPGIWELYYYKDEYRNKVQGCCSAQKSFSVQEQQAAGCASTDTVKQCMDKLIKKCLVELKPNELKSLLKQSQEKADAISLQTKQLSDQVRHLISVMP
jgi:hypothetical protein